MPGYRCSACGNRTRFDVVETKRTQAFHHFDLAGQVTVEDEEVLDHTVERVTCRWCGSKDSIEEGSASASEDEGSGA